MGGGVEKRGLSGETFHGGIGYGEKISFKRAQDFLALLKKKTMKK